MLRKWLPLLLMILSVSYGLSFIQTLTYVPYKTTRSKLTTYHGAELVALPDDCQLLKRKFPKIKKILDVADVQDHQVLMLPWKQTNNDDLVLLGETDAYEPLSRAAFYNAMRAEKTKKNFRGDK